MGGSLIHTDKVLVPIKYIKVGKDESGKKELVYKPVDRRIQTHCHAQRQNESSFAIMIYLCASVINSR